MVTAPPGVRVNAPVVVKVVEAPEKATLVSETVRSLKVLAPVKVCVPSRRATVPVMAGSVIVKSPPGSAAVKVVSLPSESILQIGERYLACR